MKVVVRLENVEYSRKATSIQTQRAELGIMDFPIIGHCGSIFGQEIGMTYV